MKYPLLQDAELEGRRVFLRADLNVPLKEGRPADDTRIRAVLPTIRYLIDHGASVVVASHLGRPGGVRNPDLSLAPVADRLEELLETEVVFAPDCTGAGVGAITSAMEPGDIVLLENLRFCPEETECDEEFARRLAGNADIYVNDAFGTSHRSHASTVGVPRVLGGGYAGLLVQKELEVFDGMLSCPKRPFTLILGGAKVSDKIPVIENLLPRLDHLLIGGGMAFTFMKEMGLDIGTSLVELDRLGAARKVMDDALDRGVDIRLPVDVVVAPSTDRTDLSRTVPADSMPSDEMGLDIGTETVIDFSGVISVSSTVVWNGPMGVFEIPPFDTGTRETASTLADAADRGVITVVGGGDSVRAVTEAGLDGRLTFVSTGGGASLKLLQGEELPALAALRGHPVCSGT